MEREDSEPVEEGAGRDWRRVLRRRLPVLAWAPTYDRDAACADLVAGVTLGLTLVPQSIAYASLANLPVQYGLYSAYLGTILYVVLGTVKEVSIGPTSLMALLTLQLCRGLPIEYVVLLTFLSGCVVLAMGLLRLGFLVDLISPSVTSGFTSATAVIIVVSQLKGLLGLSFTAESVLENVRMIAARWHQVRIADVLLGAVCCAVLLLLRKLKDVKVSPKRPKLKKTLWLLSISRNALVVLSASAFAYCMHDPDKPLFKLSGRVAAGVPPVSLPPFSVTHNNVTVTFGGMVQELGSGIVMMPIVMVLANIAIAKAFSSGGHVDATQEMVTLGLVNLAGAFVHAMPTCGAFTRSAVSHSSGVRTPAAGLYSGIITLLALVFLTQHFYFIPKACLSSVLICAVVFMIDVSTVVRVWRTARGELCVLLLTFCVSVCRTVEVAVLAGVAASLACLLRRLMRAPLHVQRVKTALGEAVVVRPSLCLVYLNSELVSRRVLRAAARHPRVLLHLAALPLIDHSAAEMLGRLVKKMKGASQKLIPYEAPATTLAVLERVPGLDTRALLATSPLAALRAVADKGEPGEGAALLAEDV